MGILDAVFGQQQPGIMPQENGGNNFMTGLQSFANTRGGLIPALLNGYHGFSTGVRADPEGMKRDALAKAASSLPANAGEADYNSAARSILGADPETAKLFWTLAQRSADNVRQTGRDSVSDKHWSADYALRKAASDRDSIQNLGGGYILRNGKVEQAFAPQPSPTPDITNYEFYRKGEEAAGRTPKAFDQWQQQGISSLTSQVQERAAIAKAMGLKEDSPSFQSYALTNKMPREDAQPLTATDKKAILEADEKSLNTNQVITNLEQAKALSPKSYEGPMAGWRGYGTSLFGNESGEATQNLENLVTSNALAQLKATFGAAPTEGERKILLDIQGSVGKTDKVRQEIYDRAIAAARRHLALNQKQVEQLRGGTYYKPGGGASSGPGVSGVAAGNIPWSVSQ